MATPFSPSVAQLSMAQLDQDFKLKEHVRQVSELMGELMANDPRVRAIRERFQIAETAVEPEEFNFELDQFRSIDDVAQECIDHNVDITANIKNVCGRAFFNPLRTGLNDPEARWVEISRPEAVDHQYELNELLFLDTNRKVIDWSLSLPKLRTIARNRKYTNSLMQKSLLRIVNQFHPEQSVLVSEYTANQLAQFLLRMDSKRDRSVYHREQLYKVVRTPEVDLTVALNSAQGYIDKMYPAALAVNASYRSTLYKTAIISFLPDELAQGLIGVIQSEMSKCTPMPDEEILRRALHLEETTRIKPAGPLYFGRKIQSKTCLLYTSDAADE